MLTALSGTPEALCVNCYGIVKLQSGPTAECICVAGTAGAVLVEPAVTNSHVRFGENGDATTSSGSDNKSAAAKLKAQMQSGGGMSWIYLLPPIM